MFLLQVMFGVLGVLVRLPRRLLLGLVLFVLGLVLLELAHPSRSVPQHAPAAANRQRPLPPPRARDPRDEHVPSPARVTPEPTSSGVTNGRRQPHGQQGHSRREPRP